MHLTTSLALLALLAPGPLSAQEETEPEPEPRGLRLRGEEATPGFTLISPLRSLTTYLLDEDGEVVHSWDTEYAPGNHAYFLEDGTLLRGARLPESPTFFAGGQAGRLQRFTWDGELVWDFVYSDEERLHHHDVEVLPNGNVLLIAYEAKTREEALRAGRDPEHVPEEGLWPDTLVEVEPVLPDGGKVVWEWHVWDHLVQDTDPDLPSFGSPAEHPELVDINADHRAERAPSEEELRRRAELAEQMRALGYVDEPPPGREEKDDSGPWSRADWLHTNSVDYHPELDLVVVSTPKMSEIWVIDHSTTTAEAAGHEGGRWGHGGDLLYRWGNPWRYGAGDESDRQLFEQHDATWLPGPGAGSILVFDNGSGRPEGDYSRVLEIVPPFDPERGFLRRPGEAFGPAEPKWSYVAEEAETFFSPFISGAQRLENGNTLICSGANGRVFEVTPAGEVVWEFLNPYGGDVPLLARKPAHLEKGPPPGAEPDGEDAGPPPGADMAPKGLFRATRIPRDHPGLAGTPLAE